MYTLDRSDYSSICNIQGIVQDYPKSTADAAEELTLRGFAADADKLNNMIRLGRLNAPNKVGKVFQWTAHAIDKAAQVLDDNEEYTEMTVFLRALNISAHDWHFHTKEYERKFGLPVNQMVLTVIPGDSVVGVTSSIVFRPLDDYETIVRCRKLLHKEASLPEERVERVQRTLVDTISKIIKTPLTAFGNTDSVREDFAHQRACLLKKMLKNNPDSKNLQDEFNAALEELKLLQEKAK